MGIIANDIRNDHSYSNLQVLQKLKIVENKT